MPATETRRRSESRPRSGSLAIGPGLVACALPLLLSPLALDATADQVDITIREGTSMAAALSPDGTTLAIDLLGTIWTLPATGGDARRLTGELGDARQPSWAPDGSRMAFQAYHGNWHIWTVAADGGDVRQETTGPFDDREPAWSHDGRRIAFSSDRTGNYDIWELELNDGRLQQLTDDPANDFGPSWSPNDDEIAFASTREPSGIWTIGAEGAERHMARATGRIAAPSWNPDGTHLLFNVIEGGTSQDRRRSSSSRRPSASPATTISVGRMTSTPRPRARCTASSHRPSRPPASGWPSSRSATSGPSRSMVLVPRSG